ncbi:hypothetical protein LUZ63_019420 [Rhynchospora breviuscula]|uniref:Uncharacterized protein n=1 Tax=Rhynchospora breviuscula TaxID=2022672 RepID=A0A9Q0C673_9POAL|nr:hypothetical protein LUZ63_019420 [Rhynchospora breviuscula]
MEEFQEAEILWPELDQDYKENCTKHNAYSRKGQTKRTMPAPVLSLTKDRTGHTWTPGFNYHGTSKHMHDDSDRDIGVEDDGDDYNGTIASGGALTKGMVPPHVLISKRYTDKITSSVCAGNGRSLKGRDLIFLRDSVHRMTGYIEK